MPCGGHLRRLANSLFMNARNPQYLMTSDFHTDMGAEGHRRAMIMINAADPTFTRAP